MVDIDPARLAATGLSPQDVVNAVTGQNVILPAGSARLGAAYGDTLPYLGLAALCALTLVALTRPRYSAAIAGN
jgi:multidrug efflux pump subunit AcrB